MQLVNKNSKLDNCNLQMLEAALGFQGSTFQVPENNEVFRGRSAELRVNKDGQPEFVSELI